MTTGNKPSDWSPKPTDTHWIPVIAASEHCQIQVPSPARNRWKVLRALRTRMKLRALLLHQLSRGRDDDIRDSALRPKFGSLLAAWTEIRHDDIEPSHLSNSPSLTPWVDHEQATVTVEGMASAAQLHLCPKPFHAYLAAFSAYTSHPGTYPTTSVR